MSSNNVDTVTSKPDRYNQIQIPPTLIEEWQKKLDHLLNLLEADVAHIVKSEENYCTLLVVTQTKGSTYFPGAVINYGEGLCSEKVLADCDELLIPDLACLDNTDYRFDLERGLRSYFGLPLFWPDGSRFGTLSLLSYQSRDYSALQREVFYQFQAKIEADLQILKLEKRLELVSSVKNKKRGSEKLRLAELPYYEMFEKSQAVMLLVDPDSGAILEANPAACDFYGYSLEQLKNKKISDLNTLSWEEIQEELRKAAQEERTHFFFRHQLASGEVRDVEVHSSPLNLYGRQVLHSIIHDITARRKAEEALQAEHYFAVQVMNAMGQGLMVTNEQTRIEFVNPAYASLLGYSQEELLGKTPFDITPLEEYERLAKARQKRQAGQSSTYETKVQRRDGTPVYVTVTGVPRWRNGKIAGTIAVITDLTERRQLEERQHRQNEYLQALHETTLDLMNRLELSDLLQTLVRRAGAMIGTQHGFIYLLDQDTNEMRVVVDTGMDANKLRITVKPGDGVAGLVWQTGQPLIVNNYQEWAGRLKRPVFEAVQAVAAAPLKSGSEIVGIIGMAYHEAGREIDEQVIELLDRFAQLASLALYNARLYSAAQRQLSELTTIQKVAHAINSSLRLEEIFETVVQQVSKAFGYKIVNIYLKSGQELIRQAYVGGEEAIPTVPLGKGVQGTVALTGKADFVRDPASHPFFKPWTPEIRQLIVIPLKTVEGQVFGTLAVASNGQPKLTDQDFDLLDLLGSQVSIAIENANLFEELRRSEEKYREVVDNLKEVVGVCDSKGRITFLNPAWEELFGYTIEDTLGKTLFDFVHPDDQPGNAEMFRLGLKGESNREGQEIRIRAKDGSYKWCLIFSQVVRDAAGQVIGLMGTLTDITARKQAEEERLTLERKLLETQKMESLGVLAGGIAHDFNNLLVGIMGNAGLALLELPPASPVREIIEQIESASQRAADLTRQMLAYSGKGRFIIQQFSLNALIEQNSALIQASFGSKVVMNYALDPDLPLLEADPDQLRQLLINLITNASDAIGETGGAIRISTGLTWADRAYLSTTYLSPELNEGYYVYLEVADTGVGMSATTQAKIFEPFFSTKFTGRGLGLAAVLGIVRGHKGAIKVESEPGKGASFRVLFPAVSVPETKLLLGGRKPDKPASAEAPATANIRTVLVVDDEELVRNTTARVLQRYGYRVLTAVDGRDGVEVFRQHAAELNGVLLDMVMPNLGGEEAFLEMQQIRADVPVILISGYSEQDATKRFNGKPLAGFLQKPYTASMLREKLESVLAQHSTSN
jgi:PAS domain S-box-containing protein